MNGYRPPRLALPVDDRRDHIRGRRNAPVTLLEYGDYECPYCGMAYPVTMRLLEDFDGEMRFAYRHFPLTQVHPHAQEAAEAAEAAGAQRRFWDMHDMLYTHQNALDMYSLFRYADEIGLDMREFQRAMTQRMYAQRVREDFMSGVRSGVNGTPTFFVNGIRYDGPHDYVSMYNRIQEVLESIYAPARR